ncbi:hypothetical protein [Acinetobacter gerneri]|uniref:hypothetical protein n=1 Tax=Acinetobacter gerneri TaxID=202952 RepID=UPI003A8BB7D6
MPNPRLIFEEACIYLFTYIGYVASFLGFTYYWGAYITSIYNKHLRQNKTISDSDLNYLNQNYGNDSQLIEGLGSVLDFFNSFIPSNILILIFLTVPYLLQFFLLFLMKHKKTNRNDYKVYMSNAITSITSAISSLMFFITAILAVSVLYIGFCLKMWVSGLIIFFFLMAVVYIIVTFAIFFMDKMIASIVKKTVN